ncbi:asparagine synthetase [Rhodopirellula maiorica SM1]|uniref:asparagine synthase (glutamine-hydrolyzing) n=1 Tax=Rhodopirellula maiorica SM1 TaxID=1265738 RepID=M5REJ9_9BACT|nr:asparagine synthase (glutamine-hydrolyzing) [Rhodopirellula maiorica]EMI17888.1 asparagine synthetase [Rhodopirellula maiorica SM1]
MCGIVGILRTDGQITCNGDVQAMTDRLVHRGPDGNGVFVDGPVGLGHRRLSIIDLVGGQQPLGNEDGKVHVTFNGEIYNFRELQRHLQALGHVFRTSSDTEVLVHAWEEWGTDCVSHLRGMFAFAIWDARKQQLFLARDRVGIKPLLYSWQNGYLAFASEMQAFAALPHFEASIDVQAIDQYLHYQYIPAPRSIYTQVRKLLPGHSVLVDARRPQEPQQIRYWQLQFAPDRSLNEAQWIERIDIALEETIRTHLVSDVPFGAFLSGGIDSSTIVAYMSRILDQPVKAFCIGHADTYYDERNWAKEAARVAGAEYFEEVVEPDGLELLPALVQHYGEPFADSSAIPTWYVSRLARRHVKMVLSGDGGDELFAGYHAYAAVLCGHRKPMERGRRLRHQFANGARRVGLWPSNPSVGDSKYARTAAMQTAERAELWRPEFLHVMDTTRSEFDQRFSNVQSREMLNELQAFDIANYIPFDNLTKVDIASMSHGLEVRVPLLDHVFMETAAQVPPELKLKPNLGNGNGRLETLQSPTAVVGKHLLKENAGQFFSGEFLHREKKGFEVPIRNWFADSHRDELHDRLNSRDTELSEYFSPKVVRRLVNAASTDKVAAWKAWSLLVLDEWLRSRQSSVVG